MQNELPPPGAIRVEELINYFSYDYPPPEEGKPVSLTTHLVASPWNRQHQMLQPVDELIPRSADGIGRRLPDVLE